MLDSNILCNNPFVMSLHQSHKDYCQWYYKVLYRRLLQDNPLDMMSLTQSTFLWTSFCIKVSNLDIDFQYPIPNMDTFPYFPYDNLFLIESYLFIIMSTWPFDSCLIILVKNDSSSFFPLNALCIWKIF